VTKEATGTNEPRVVVCYGDSNTWGSDTATGERQPLAQRWTSVLARELGPGFQVIAEGLGGRTTVFDDPAMPGRDGSAFLLPCLWSHAPIDTVVVMLGTNDTKAVFGATADAIAAGMERLVAMIREEIAGADGTVPGVLVVAPPPLGELARGSGFWDEAGIRESRRLAAAYRGVAERHGAMFLDAGAVIASSAIDGVHIDVADLRILGTSVARRLRG
jgi:lysophospholipase L1-like esterase